MITPLRENIISRDAVALSIALFAVWGLMLREAWRAWQPTRLLRLDRYDEARAAADRLERSWLRIFPSIRFSARCVMGTALHLSGDLEGSRRVLAPLHAENLRANLRYALLAVEAANLVLLDREHAQASALLAEAAKIQESVEDVLLAAHAQLGAGDPRGAAKLFAKASAMPSGKKTIENAIVHALRGLYLAKMGSALEARAELALAADASLTNVYVRRARAALELAPSDPGDPRSSLAPQIVDEVSE